MTLQTFEPTSLGTATSMYFVVWVNEKSIKIALGSFLVYRVDFKSRHCGELDTKHNINMSSK